MSIPAAIVSNVRSRVSDLRARRRRDDLLRRIGELTYAQRTDLEPTSTDSKHNNTATTPKRQA